LLQAWKTSRILAISPHLDDAVLSAGATLSSWTVGGRSASVLTVFAGKPEGELSPAARNLHARCGLDDAVTTRRVEDRMALERVGARAIHGNLLDAIYRRRPDGTWLCQNHLDVFAEQPVDRELEMAALDLVLQTVDQIQPGLLLAPQAVGDHIDHHVVRRAAMSAARLRHLPLLLWEDLPYGSTRQPLRRDGAMYVAYTPRTLCAKLNAVMCYASQLAIVWPDGGDWRAALGEAGRTADNPAGEWFRHESNEATTSA
jgi:LmbE family N-acetylglucosaminyl deacetylase